MIATLLLARVPDGDSTMMKRLTCILILLSPSLPCWGETTVYTSQWLRGVDNIYPQNAPTNVKVYDSGRVDVDEIHIHGYFVSASDATGNWIENAGRNTVDAEVTGAVLAGGGYGTVRNNHIGLLGGIPYSDDVTPPGWSADNDYVPGFAGVASILGGYDHICNQLAGTIGGGGHNFIKYHANGHSAIFGGSFNVISGSRAFIGGGNGNSVGPTASCSVISGGQCNGTAASWATVPGGRDNDANGVYSFASGRRAKAIGAGTHVFTDSQDSDWVVPGPNVGSMRFSGGVGINTTDPNYPLDVDGDIQGENIRADDNAYVGGNAYVTGSVRVANTTALVVYGSQGYDMRWLRLPETVTVAKGASSGQSVTLIIPEGSVVEDVVCRVTAVPTSGTGPLPTHVNVYLTTKDSGDAQHDTIFDNLTMSVGTTGRTWLASGSGGGDGTYNAPFAVPTANTVTVVLTDGNDTPVVVPADADSAFSIRIAVNLRTSTAPTS